MKHKTFGALGSLALAALTACEAEHTVDAENYGVSFQVQSDLSFGGSPLTSLEVRVVGRRDAKLESLVVTCDGVSDQGEISEASSPPRPSAAQSFFTIELPRRAGGESYACVLTWSDGERTFYLPNFEPPELNAPAAGATLRVSEALDFDWPTPAPVAEARSTFNLNVTGDCVTGLRDPSLYNQDDDGAFLLPADSIKIDRAPCPGRVLFTRRWSMTPPSEGDFEAELGFEKVEYTAQSIRGHDVTFVP